MKSLVIKRSIQIGRHKTSVSLEEQFFSALKEISIDRQISLSALVSSIDNERQTRNLSSGVRLFVLEYFRAKADKNFSS
jgi:hypothetical protein